MVGAPVPGLTEVGARWGLVVDRAEAGAGSGTWAVRRDGVPLVLKYFASPSWEYELRVAAALRSQGWPTPVPVASLFAADGRSLDGPALSGPAWVLFERLPGSSRAPGPGEQRSRGRLLASLHLAAAACGISDPRPGFPAPSDVVGDPLLERLLRSYARDHPADGALLLDALSATAGWFADHPSIDAPRSVIHGDFAPWNLLFEDGQLTGVLDFEASHHTFQVADFALSWRGYQDDLLRGYDTVRPLSDLEWQLIRPCYQAWLFLGMRADLESGAPPDLSWQVAHLQKRSALVD